MVVTMLIGVLIAALAAGMTHANAARTAGISERKARRRMEDGAFSPGRLRFRGLEANQCLTSTH